MDIFQLAYISNINLSERDSIEREIDEILSDAIENNKEKNLTGILLYRDGVFLQLLEGDRESLLDTFGRIAADLRHENIKTLVKQNAPERLFGLWSMAYKNLKSNKSDSSLEDITGWENIVDKTSRRKYISSDEIMAFLKEFRFRLNENE